MLETIAGQQDEAIVNSVGGLSRTVAFANSQKGASTRLAYRSDIALQSPLRYHYGHLNLLVPCCSDAFREFLDHELDGVTLLLKDEEAGRIEKELKGVDGFGNPVGIFFS